ncbi:MAG: hypothetical protein GPOALKHO_000895 [Sodalis sp.]|nr:MAG: hypothetical protein GPOALKHO_000895 [Sodalis sp.]
MRPSSMKITRLLRLSSFSADGEFVEQHRHALLLAAEQLPGNLLAHTTKNPFKQVKVFSAPRLSDVSDLAFQNFDLRQRQKELKVL